MAIPGSHERLYHNRQSSEGAQLEPPRCVPSPYLALARFGRNRLYHQHNLELLEMVRRQVSVIFAGGEHSALAAKAATTTIPIVFLVSNDPVIHGLVASIARPDGNVTGVNFVSSELTAKRLELLRELVPTAARVAVLANPNSPVTATTLKDLEPAARVMGLQIQVIRVSTVQEMEVAFSGFARERPDALFVSSDPLFTSRRVQLANLASRHAIPMTSITREVTDVGGLMSYGGNIVDGYRQAGIYVGRILKDAKPADPHRRLAPKHFNEARTIADQAALFGHFGPLIDRRQSQFRGTLDDDAASAGNAGDGSSAHGRPRPNSPTVGTAMAEGDREVSRVLNPSPHRV